MMILDDDMINRAAEALLAVAATAKAGTDSQPVDWFPAFDVRKARSLVMGALISSLYGGDEILISNKVTHRISPEHIGRRRSIEPIA